MRGAKARDSNHGVLPFFGNMITTLNLHFNQRTGTHENGGLNSIFNLSLFVLNLAKEKITILITTNPPMGGWNHLKFSNFMMALKKLFSASTCN